MTFAEIRKHNGITQQALADQLGVKQSTVAMWETGKSIPPVKTLVRLSEILNTELTKLVSAFTKQ